MMHLTWLPLQAAPRVWRENYPCLRFLSFPCSWKEGGSWKIPQEASAARGLGCGWVLCLGFFSLIVLETVSSREGKLVLPLGGLQQSLFPFFPVVLCALGWCLWEQFCSGHGGRQQGQLEVNQAAGDNPRIPGELDCHHSLVWGALWMLVWKTGRWCFIPHGDPFGISWSSCPLESEEGESSLCFLSLNPDCASEWLCPVFSC